MRSVAKTILFVILFFGICPDSFADMCMSAGESLEGRVPPPYTIESMRGSRFSLGRILSRITGRNELDGEKQKTPDPGLYKITYNSRKGSRTETLFVNAPLDYKSNKLPSIYRQLLYFYDRDDRKAMKYYTEFRDIKLRDGDGLDVELRTKKDSAGAISRFVAQSGGELVSTAGNRMHVRVPLSVLNILAMRKDVLDIPYATSDLDEVVSKGVKYILADKWHLAGYNGSGIKVGILDIGFMNYQERQSSGDLPADLNTAAFGYDNIDLNDDHGAECAEIVYDVAPGVVLYLVAYDADFDSDFINAVDYLISQGVDVISHSISHYQGPFDGTSARARKITEAVNQGVMWINSSGNMAALHNEGQFKDNGEGYHVWSGMDIFQNINMQKNQVATLRLSWNDWSFDETGAAVGNASNQDYAIEIFKIEDGEASLVDVCNNDQQNNSEKNPYEECTFKAMSTGTYGITVKSINNTDLAEYLELFVKVNAKMEYYLPYGSSTVPGNAVGAISVGAVKLGKVAFADQFSGDSGYLEKYSSQGPTNGSGGGKPDDTSRTKPDLVAPTFVTTFSGEFSGTSAATPHVAGAAALVKQAKGFDDPAAVGEFLKNHVSLLGYPSENNKVGKGLINLYDNTVMGEIDETYDELEYLYSYPRRVAPNWNGTLHIYGYNFKDVNSLEFINTNPEGNEVIAEIQSQSPNKIIADVSANNAHYGKYIKIAGGGKEVIVSYKFYTTYMTQVMDMLPKQGYPGWWGYGGIGGTKLPEGMEVDLGEGISVEVLDWSTNGQLYIKIDISEDAIPGWRNLTVTDPAGNVYTVQNALQVLESASPIPLASGDCQAVKINSINPATVTQGAGQEWITTFQVYGQGFQEGLVLDLSDGITYSFEGEPGAIYYANNTYFNTKYQVDSNAQIGKKDVKVTNPNGLSCTLEKALMVVPGKNSPPGIIDVSPAELYKGDEALLRVELSKPAFSLDVAPTVEIPGVDMVGVSYALMTLDKADFPVRVDPLLQVYDEYADVTVNTGTVEAHAVNMIRIKNPEIIAVNPSKGIGGSIKNIHIFGEGTHFGENTQVHVTSHWNGEDLPPEDFVGDITVSNVEFVSSTEIKATISIVDDAFPSKRNVGVSTPDLNGSGKPEIIWMNESFEVLE